jgi:ABC-2 type transport system permease protein
MSGAALARVSALRAVWLLTRLRLLRLVNLFAVIGARRTAARSGGPRSGGPPVRSGTGAKKRNRWVVSALVALFMLLVYGNLTRQSVINLHFFLDGPDPDGPQAPLGVLSEALLRGLSMELSLLALAATLGSLASRELSNSDWDLEWLTTLPVKPLTLQWARIIERSVANPFALLMFLPLGTVVAWLSGYRWSAPLVGALAVAPLLPLTAMARTLVDTGLRLSLSASRLRNLNALLSIVSILVLYSVISLAIRTPLGFIIQWARDFPEWACWFPPGLVVRALNTQAMPLQLELYGLLLAEVALLLLLGFALLGYQLRQGVVAAGARETGRKSANAAPRPAPARPLMAWGTVVQRRELKLLSRDRTFLVQTLVLPVIIVASQIIFQGRLHGASIAHAGNALVASTAFALAAYTLMMSAYQTLNTEGGSLWLLFTVPRSLDSILSEKARLWSVLALLYPLLVFAAVMIMRGRVDLELLGLAAVVLFGVPIYSVIAVALGVFGSDPLAQDARTRLRPTYVYMYFSLAGIYTYAIFASEWWQKIVLVALSGLLALALWQKARDELPFLLDPAASPPARVSTSDGVIGAMLFFVVQGIFAAIALKTSRHISGGALTFAYAIAGGFTFLLFRYFYWRAKTAGVPRVFGAQAGRAVLIGLGAGCIAALGGVLYLHALRVFDIAPQQLLDSARGIAGSLWIPVLAIVAAPIFEEFIFRGLIFGGLRRSLGLLASVTASAAVFAVVHPPLSMIPVFGLGVCAAFAYDRGQMLLAPMVAHGVYNAVILADQLQLLP